MVLTNVEIMTFTLFDAMETVEWNRVVTMKQHGRFGARRQLFIGCLEYEWLAEQPLRQLRLGWVRSQRDALVVRIIEQAKRQDRRERSPGRLPGHPGGREQPAAAADIPCESLVVVIAVAAEVVFSAYDHDDPEDLQACRIQPIVKEQQSVGFVDHTKTAGCEQPTHVTCEIAAIADEQRRGRI